MAVKQLIKNYLVNKENKKYQGLLSERKVSYETWLSEKQREWKLYADAEISEVPELILVQFTAGSYEPIAKKAFQRFFAEHPDCSVCYCDEDTEGKNPRFKPDWSPDLLDSRLYIGSCLAVRRSLWQSLQRKYQKIMPGRFEEIVSSLTEDCFCISDFEAFERFVHHCAESAGGGNGVGHLAQVMFHAKAGGETEAKLEKLLSETAFLQNRYKEYLTEAEALQEEAPGKPLVSVIIPSKDHPEVLGRCVESIRSFADVTCQLIVVDNGSSEENRELTEKLLEKITTEEANRFILSAQYIYEPAEFNFSRMCNAGAKAADGRLLLFLNDDVTLTQPVLKELAARALRPRTGAVGLKLLYPDSDRIQHAGIVNLPMGPVHKMQFLSDSEEYYGRANRGMVNCLAVTAACLLVEKTKFDRIGGFNEELRVAFNDVALCFALYEEGFTNVCMNRLAAYHHESLSRGDDESAEKIKRLQSEKESLYRLYPGLEGRDPYYSEHLNRDGLDVRIRPAYLSSGNRVQRGAAKLLKHLNGCRRDDCLLIRVEDIREQFMSGYSVVLGDDNACYEKRLLLKHSESGKIYEIPAEGQYRQDLEENMPDQRNVGLSGFMISLTEAGLPEGTYLAGMLARNRVTGLKLVNWSKREITIRSNRT